MISAKYVSKLGKEVRKSHEVKFVLKNVRRNIGFSVKFGFHFVVN